MKWSWLCDLFWLRKKQEPNQRKSRQRMYVCEKSNIRFNGLAHLITKSVLPA